MHQILFRLRLRPRPHWGSSQLSPKPPSWNLGGPISKGRKGKRTGLWEGIGGVNGGGKGMRAKRGKGRRRKGDEAIQLRFLATPLIPATKSLCFVVFR